MDKKKKDYSNIICQECLSCAEDKGYDKYMFHFVHRGRYIGLFCEKCIEKEKLETLYPFYKKPKSKSLKKDK